jgi:hypothetical protein
VAERWYKLLASWACRIPEDGSAAELGYDERDGERESAVASVHTWRAAMSFASGAWAMLHAAARVARSSRSTGTVWAMMMLVVGGWGMGNGEWGMGGEDVQGVEGDRRVGLFVVCCVVQYPELITY